MASTREDAKRAAAAGLQMQEIVRSKAIVAAAVSEPDQDLLRPKTTAVCDGDGWVLNGRKIISSMAPAATHFAVSVDYVDRSGEERYAYAIVPRNTPGITVHDDWDALGMRASASVSVTFENCSIPNGPGRGAIAGIITAEYLEQASSPDRHTRRHRLALRRRLSGRWWMPSVATRAQGRRRRALNRAHLAAENAIDLAAARAIFSRAVALVDEHYAVHPAGYGSLEAANAIFAEVQAAKVVCERCGRAYRRPAMTIVGGGAFMNTHPLSRHYRDARAGAFMQPLGANLAFEYIGAVALGMSPEKL